MEHYLKQLLNVKLKFTEKKAGLLVHFQSHTDKGDRDSLLKTMIHRSYALLSATEVFNAERAKLCPLLSRLDLIASLIDSAMNIFFY